VAKNRKTVRFGVGRPEGPRSHVWLLSASKKDSDVFITGYGIRRTEKVTLHKSGKWRKAFMASSPFVLAPPVLAPPRLRWQQCAFSS